MDYIRIHTAIRRHRKVRGLADAEFRFLICLWTLAMDEDKGGALPVPDEISIELLVPLPQVEIMLARLEELKFLTRTEHGFRPRNWDKWQYGKKADAPPDLPKPRKGVFVKPTAHEVTAYAQEIGFALSGQSFIDFYESKGWKIGPNLMKDWKAAVRTWRQREPDRGLFSSDETQVW